MKKIAIFLLLLIIFACEDDKDTTGPEVTITSPANNATLGELVTIKVNTTDKSGILKVDFYIDNSKVFSDTTLPYEYEWNTTTTTDSEHTIKVTSYDMNENFTETEPITVTVNNDSKRPKPINVTSVTYNLETMTVQWDSSNELDFKEYILYYSESRTGTKEPIKTYNNIVNTKYETTDFNPLKENWYFIEVVDQFGLKTMGNGKSNSIDQPPTPAQLSVDVSDNQFKISWIFQEQNDHTLYELIESETEDMANQKVIVSSETNSSNEYIVTGIGENERKFYRFDITDYWGLISKSELAVGSTYKKIAVLANDNHNSYTSDFYLSDVDGGYHKKISEKVYSRDFTFHPNGLKAFYVRGNGSSTDIYSVDLDGYISNLTDNDYADFAFSLSYDGSFMVYRSTANEHCISKINTDGSNLTEYCDDLYTPYHPVISSDGTKIWFTSAFGGILWDLYEYIISTSTKNGLASEASIAARSSDASVFVYNHAVKGANQLILRAPNNETQFTSDANASNMPVFSPDNSYIYYVSGLHGMGPVDIYRYDIASNQNTQLTTFSEGIHSLDVSSDGKTLVFVITNGTREIVYTMNADGSNLQEIIQNNIDNDFQSISKVVFQPY